MSSSLLFTCGPLDAVGFEGDVWEFYSDFTFHIKMFTGKQSCFQWRSSEGNIQYLNEEDGEWVDFERPEFHAEYQRYIARMVME